jgi:preprotein translocase subunit SecG
MITLLTIIHIVVCLFMVCIVLLQHGKGADIGATFGGSSQSLFGTEGPVPMLNKVTTAAAIIFMVTSISLAYLSAHRESGSVMRGYQGAPPAPAGKIDTNRVPESVPPATVPMPAPAAEEPAPAEFPESAPPATVPMPAPTADAGKAPAGK